MSTVAGRETAEDLQSFTKPAFLRQVRIRGYKSIAFCDVALQPLTILIGRNAAGKSNFLDALAFVRDVLKTSVSEAVTARGGLRSLFSRQAQRREIAITLEIDLGGGSAAEFGFIIQEGPQDVPFRSHEWFRVLPQPAAGDPPQLTLGYFREVTYDASQPAAYSESSITPQALCPPTRQTTSPPVHLWIKSLEAAPFPEIVNRLSRAGYYNFVPGKMRELQPISLGEVLAQDGRNMAAILRNFRRFKDQWAEDRVGAYLAAIVPEVAAVRAVEYGQYETVSFRLRGDGPSSAQEYDAAVMSDGTLRVLGALLAVFQVGPEGTPSIVGIEEPESSLHPAAMQALVDALDDATQRTQVIVTTHSGELLDWRDIEPGQVLVVRNQGGRTEIAPIGPAGREILQRELYSLAELQRTDQLDLDEADLQRQAERVRAGGD